MSFLEIRRHSIQGFGGSLSQEGVELARKAGEQTGPFSLVLTSPIPRAQETALAMGFAVHSTEEWLGFLPDDLQWSLDYRSGFSAFYNAFQENSSFQKQAQIYKDRIQASIQSLDSSQNALIVSHGGTVEMLAIACANNTDFQSWNFGVSQMQGVRIEWNEHGFQSAVFLE